MLRYFGASGELIEHIESVGLHVNRLNSMFIRSPSKTFLQSPANWQLLHFGHPQARMSDADVIAACKLKWAFKAKPDLVLQPTPDMALCIELKLESGEGTYPAEPAERRLLRERKLYFEGGKLPFPMRQTDLQRELMFCLFGERKASLLLVQKRTLVNRAGIIAWRDLIELLRVPADAPAFVREALKRF